MHEWPGLKPYFEDPRIASYGYVDKKSFVAAVENYRMGKSINLAMFLKLLSLEFWLRRLETVQPSPVTTKKSPEVPMNGQYSRFTQNVCAPERS